MTSRESRFALPNSLHRTFCLLSMAALVIGFGLCSSPVRSFAEQAAAPPHEEEEEPAEWLAKPEELAHVATNDIVKSLRLNGQAVKLGREVYEKSCASCHGEDLKGIPAQHTPDLTDAEWRFSGDDLA